MYQIQRRLPSSEFHPWREYALNALREEKKKRIELLGEFKEKEGEFLRVQNPMLAISPINGDKLNSVASSSV
jgi:hypothetical protein